MTDEQHERDLGQDEERTLRAVVEHGTEAEVDADAGRTLARHGLVAEGGSPDAPTFTATDAGRALVDEWQDCHPSHFARAFQRRYGVSPSAFRAESCRAEPHNDTEGQLLLTEQLQEEYDSCVGRVRTDTADASFARVAAAAG